MLIAISMIKNEEDIVGHTVQHLLAQGVNKIICYDNMSTDRTPQILAGNPQIQVFPDREFAYNQAEKMNRLAINAYQDGADWILPFDADEMICPPIGHTLHSYFNSLTSDIGVIRIQGWDFLPRDCRSSHPNPYYQFEYRREAPQPYPKIAFRATPTPDLHMGNHGINNIPGETVDGLTLRHIQYRTVTQMAAKLRNGKAVYDATNFDQGQGAHWRTGGTLTDQEMADKWSELCEEPAVHDPL